MNPTQSKEVWWEKEFEKQFYDLFHTKNSDLYFTESEIKKFISNLLSSTKQSLQREMVANAKYEIEWMKKVSNGDKGQEWAIQGAEMVLDAIKGKGRKWEESLLKEKV